MKRDYFNRASIEQLTINQMKGDYFNRASIKCQVTISTKSKEYPS